MCPTCKSEGQSQNEDQTNQITQLKRELTAAKGTATKVKNERDSHKMKINDSDTTIADLISRVSSLEFVISDVKKIIDEQLASGQNLTAPINQCALDLSKNQKVLENAHKSLASNGSSSSQSDAIDSANDNHKVIMQQTVDLTRDARAMINTLRKMRLKVSFMMQFGLGHQANPKTF